MAQYDVPDKSVPNLMEIAQICYNYQFYKERFDKLKDMAAERQMNNYNTQMKQWLKNNIVKK